MDGGVYGKITTVLLFLTICHVLIRSSDHFGSASSGVTGAFVISCITWLQIMVVSTFLWPSNSYTSRILTPFMSKCFAKLWRSVCRGKITKSH